MALENEYEAIEMINKINLFLSTKNIQFQFDGYDLIKIKKLFSISSLSLIPNGKEKQRKIEFVNLTKNEIKLKYDLNNNKFFLLLIYYYIYKDYKILSCVKIFYKSNLISFHTIYLFLDFFLEINDEININKNLYFKNIILVISYLKKFIINTKKEANNNKNLINKDIHNLLEKIFSKINIHKIENIIFCKNLIKHPNLLSLLKLSFDYYENDILNDDNKQYIINNLKNLYTNHLNFDHMNYLYKTSKKYLTSNFNKFNNQIVKKGKNYYSFNNGILSFLEQIMKNKSPYLLDKYFIFNSKEEKKGVLITSPINLNEGYNSSGFNLSFIFSFMVIKSNDKKNMNNKDRVILSVNDYKNDKYIFRFLLDGNNLYINLYEQNKYLLLKNIEYNVDYLCYAYYDENDKLFHFHPKTDNNIINRKIITKETDEIYFELGNTIYNNNDNDNQNMKFSGLIGPVLVFNSKIENPLDIYQKLSEMKKYYLLGDIIINSNNNDNIYFSYDEYHGILNNKNELIKIISDLKKVLQNLIYYINPEVISNNLNFYNGNRFRDYQIYNDPFNTKNYQNLDKYYEIKNTQNYNDFILIQHSFEEFFIKNIFDYFVFNIELIYNELLQSANNNIPEKENKIL